MRRPIARILLCLLALAPAACSNNSTATIPTPVITTDTFTGTLNQNSAVTNTFTTKTAGPVSATLTTVAPDATLRMGFSLGTYNTTLGVCQIVLDNPLALQGAILSGTASTAGTYCIRVYDIGQITADNGPFSFTLTVVHP